MEAKELRIGNYVIVDNPKHHPSLKKEVSVITSVSEESVGIQCDVELHYYDIGQRLVFIKPIPLTEEWLIKFGFVYDENTGFFRSVVFGRIYIDNGRHTFCFCNKNGILKVVEYVHQLQNLYFALTGEELEIK